MHLKSVTLLSQKYPTTEHYPFNLPLFQQTKTIQLDTPVTFFVGENGTGKSTLLEAITHRCGIHIWRDVERTRYQINPYEKHFQHYIRVGWVNGKVPGSYFGSDTFNYFTRSLDEWAAADPGMLQYFGGQSLVTQSHGQSLMSYFRSRYKIKGLYLLDEPETALSPRSQVGLVKLLQEMGQAGHAQFIVATHSPILLACPGAKILSFDNSTVQPISYKETDYYQLYKAFMNNPEEFLAEDSQL